MKKMILFLLLLLPQVGFCGGLGMACSGSLLYWRADEQGLGYTTKPANVLTTDNFTEHSDIHPKFQWDWGMRLQADYTDCCLPCWSFQGFWTYVKLKAHGHRSYNSGAPDFKGIYPIWSMGPDTLPNDYVSSASSHWHLTTNIIDLNAQYNCFCFCNGFAIYPFAGLRVALLNQQLTAKYEGGIFYSGIDHNRLRSHYIGAGPRFGLNVEYALACGFSLFGRAGAAPLFGRFHLKQHETYLDNVLLHRSRTDHHMVVSTDYCIGLKWTGEFCRDFCVDMAWEGQEFFQANRFFRGKYHFFSKDRALFLYGITLSASLGF